MNRREFSKRFAGLAAALGITTVVAEGGDDVELDAHELAVVEEPTDPACVLTDGTIHETDNKVTIDTEAPPLPFPVEGLERCQVSVSQDLMVYSTYGFPHSKRFEVDMTFREEAWPGIPVPDCLHNRWPLTLPAWPTVVGYVTAIDWMEHDRVRVRFQGRAA